MVLLCQNHVTQELHNFSPLGSMLLYDLIRSYLIPFAIRLSYSLPPRLPRTPEALTKEESVLVSII